MHHLSHLLQGGKTSLHSLEMKRREAGRDDEEAKGRWPSSELPEPIRASMLSGTWLHYMHCGSWHKPQSLIPGHKPGSAHPGLIQAQAAPGPFQHSQAPDEKRYLLAQGAQRGNDPAVAFWHPCHRISSNGVRILEFYNKL